MVFFCSHQIRVTSPAADGNLRLCHVIITLDYVRKFVCVLTVYTGILQGLDRKDSTTIPPLSPLMELPEKFDVKNICVGIPKVCSPLATFLVYSS